nr:EOG090X02EM [Leptodora kindtii]
MSDGRSGSSIMSRMEESEIQAWDRLADWDSGDQPLAPLTDYQRNSVFLLASLCSGKCAPIKQVVKDVEVTHGDESIGGKHADVTILESFSALKLGMKQIDSSQQFYQWYSELEWEMLQEEDAEFRVYLSQLEQHKEDCKDLLKQVATTLDNLSKLGSQYTFVSNKTNSLHEACQQMLDDQTKLSAMADDLENRISYFLEYEKIQSQLSSPTLSVHGDHFRGILNRLDKCISYMQSHPLYKESAVHLTKYRVCLNTALSLVRSWVLQALEQCVQQAKPGHSNRAANGADSSAYTLLYGKFRLHADKMKLLMTDLEKRVCNSSEYEQLLSDCQAHFFQQRLGLLRPSVMASLTDLSEAHVRDYCVLSRSACAFILRLCHDEWQLFHQFFGKASPLLEGYTDELCDLLYDTLRPHIIHINHLETMAELCFILRVEMIEEHVNNNPEQLASFRRSVTQLLADVQERLVYRTHIYVQSDIIGYKPVAGDLAYPDKLEMMDVR